MNHVESRRLIHYWHLKAREALNAIRYFVVEAGDQADYWWNYEVAHAHMRAQIRQLRGRV